MTEKVLLGDCLHVLDDIASESVDLVYADPPFCTQTVQQLLTRDGKNRFSFPDVWESDSSYANFILQRLTKARDKLKKTGSLFFHCDKSASHVIRLLLEHVFGSANFQAEIIWSFRRWSNAKRGLLDSHQTIYFFSKGSDFRFFPVYQDYSPLTNVEQIMQRRTRDERNKAVYARSDDGEVIGNGAKRGVPLGDVWDLPFLNPKAKERVGYPTQKPVVLLERIIKLVTVRGDVVLDPFCGSGTTLVAAQALGRHAVGIDISNDAVALTRQRLRDPVITEPALLDRGRAACETHAQDAAAHLAGIDYIPVYRNKGIDGLLKKEIDGHAVFLRVQRRFETQDQAADALVKASRSKGHCLLVVVATKTDLFPRREQPDVLFIKSAGLSLEELEAAIRKERPQSRISVV